MSQSDRTRRSVPARIPGPAAAPGPAPTAPGPPRAPDPGPAGRGISARLAWRAVRRYWWQILLAWAAGSSGLIWLAFTRLHPSFGASSAIRVDPGDRGPARGDFEVFKETQARRLAHPNVVASAIAAHPELIRLPGLARAADPGAAVLGSIDVMVVPGTDLIRVAMSSGSARESAEVVNAVIEAYLKDADADARAEVEESEARRRRLRDARDERALAVRRGREAVAAIAARVGGPDAGRARVRDASALETYGFLTRQLIQADLDLIEATSRLDPARDDPAEAPVDPSRPDVDAVAAFYADPRVAELQSRLSRDRDAANQADGVVQASGSAPSTASQRRADEIQAQIDALWAKMKPELLRASRAGQGRGAARQAARARVEALKARSAHLNDRLGRLGDRGPSAGADELALEFARQDLGRAEAMLDAVARDLDRVEFEARARPVRIAQEYRAEPPGAPDADRRIPAMAAAPLGVLAGLVGLAVMAELHAGRVADPDDLPGRLRINVLGVVPPLPGRTTPPARPSARARRDLDQFVQCLDHLRVAICSGPGPGGRGPRSIIVTSACGGEGKTTLAAQLAGRCANAGLLTLLVDADLRNPSLSRMFDRDGGRGLVDVLRGEATAEEAISVIGDAGGFHFLPAGSPRVDPSRLLHGDRLARLLAGARDSFDFVIVDAPPVLPVPDALTVGRWVDAAILAVRADDSRYHLIGLANRRLADVGVPVLGAVVNGVRGAEARYYGSYYAPAGTIEGGPPVGS